MPNSDSDKGDDGERDYDRAFRSFEATSGSGLSVAAAQASRHLPAPNQPPKETGQRWSRYFLGCLRRYAPGSPEPGYLADIGLLSSFPAASVRSKIVALKASPSGPRDARGPDNLLRVPPLKRASRKKKAAGIARCGSPGSKIVCL